ncbi:Signal transduction histidine kinase subgroup 3 dimerisation and phosphoacceptor domain-containing protein [Deinococcus saxicola]|uniref:sensor histidine kinase n=1 Tax=Deinococcus saxicola TaxID=249406 RepID=UPI0039EFD77F
MVLTSGDTVTLPSDPFFPARNKNVTDALSPVIGRLMFALMYSGQAVLIASLLLTQPGALDQTAMIVGIAGYLGFGACLAGQSWPGASGPVRVCLTAGMSVCSLLFNLTFSRLDGFTALSLQIVSAIVIVTVVPSRVAVLWITLQSVLLAWANAWGVSLVYTALLYPSYTVLQLFSAYLMKILLRERQQRLEMIRLNTELKSARNAIAAASQLAERHRIARDLHDTLGHSLTALSLELEFARQVQGQRKQDALARAQDINQQLLSEVRQTVNTIREPQELGLREQLKRLGDPFPALDLRVHLDPALTLGPVVGETFLKCVREAVTNAVKHASAPQISVHLSRDAGGARLRIGNALGATVGDDWQEGYGLLGMRERLEAIGGCLLVRRNTDSFQVEAVVPLDPHEETP